MSREAKYWREKIAAMSDEELVSWIRSLVHRIAAPVVAERRRLLEAKAKLVGWLDDLETLEGSVREDET